MTTMDDGRNRSITDGVIALSMMVNSDKIKSGQGEAQKIYRIFGKFFRFHVKFDFWGPFEFAISKFFPIFMLVEPDFIGLHSEVTNFWDFHELKKYLQFFEDFSNSNRTGFSLPTFQTFGLKMCEFQTN